MADEEDTEERGDLNLFKEPEGYYEPEKQHTIATHTTLNGQTLNLRLVGHNPLWVRFVLHNSTHCRPTSDASNDLLSGKTSEYHS
jgi:nicotinamide N-methyltransferase